jgi:hypothetical protein
MNPKNRRAQRPVAMAVMAAPLLLLLAACAAPPDAPGTLAPSTRSAVAASTHYRCDQGVGFDVVFGNDAAVFTGASGREEQLLRDAGGVTPLQTVYSNSRLRAEFGLGVDGRGALLHQTQPPALLRCTRQ